MSLKTNYKDSIFIGDKKFKMITNSDGTISLKDVTEYSEIGDDFGSNDVNSITTKLNELDDNNWQVASKTGDELSNYTLVDGYLVNEKNKKLFNRYEKLIPVKLFENETGTTETITLSKSINDFNSIEIFGVSSDKAVCYTKINKENYSNVAALYGFSTDGNLYAKIAYLNLVDNQITFRSNRSWYKHQTNGSGGYNANANEIKITKVIGNYY